MATQIAEKHFITSVIPVVLVSSHMAEQNGGTE